MVREGGSFYIMENSDFQNSVWNVLNLYLFNIFWVTVLKAKVSLKHLATDCLIKFATNY